MKSLGTDLPLWQESDPPSAPCETSRAAARRAAPKIANRKVKILGILSRAGAYGRTDHELADEMGLCLQSAVSCRNALMNDGEVTYSGKKRPTYTGSPARVWVLSDKTPRASTRHARTGPDNTTQDKISKKEPR